MKHKKYIVPIIPILTLGLLMACSSSDNNTLQFSDASSDENRKDVSIEDQWHFPNTYPDAEPDVSNDVDLVFDGNFPDTGPPVPNNGIPYLGGPVILGTINVYVIWYGNWLGNSARTIIPDLFAGLNGSAYYYINTTYFMQNPENRTELQYVSNSISYKGSIDNNYSLGASLSDENIASIVSTSLDQSLFPVDTNALYYVLTSADVLLTGSGSGCITWCGWHNHMAYKDKDIKYSVVLNPDACPTACSNFVDLNGYPIISPNNNLGADAMASIIAHELEETHTDPDLNAWASPWTGENADMGAWQFLDTYQTANGAKANMKLGNRDFLIQSNWVNAGGGYLALHYP